MSHSVTTLRPTHRSSSRSTSVDRYLNAARKYPRMSAQQERDGLERIATERMTMWRALLSWPAAIPFVLDRLEQRAKDKDLPGDELAALRDAGEDDDARTAFLEAFGPSDCGHGDAIAREIADVVPTFKDAGDRAKRRDYLRRVRRAHRGYERARNRFVRRNLRLVLMVARRFSDNRLPLADRIQDGNLGLLKAVDRFDVRRQTRFSTYAVWWIRHYITRALVNRGRAIRIPANLHRIYMKARSERPKLVAELGRAPTDAELARALEIDEDKLLDASEAMELRAVGLDSPASSEGTRTVAEMLESPGDAELDERLAEERNLAAANRALDDLEPMARDILVHRFGLEGTCPTTLRELGERYDLSRERIRQLQNKALGKLREMITAQPASLVA